MKNLKAFLCAVVVCAAFTFPGDADAGLFFGRNKNSTCEKGPDGKCLVHEGGNATGTNADDDPETLAYLQTLGFVPAAGTTAAKVDPNPTAPTANGGHVTESDRTAPDVPETTEALDVGTAATDVADKREALAIALGAEQQAIEAKQRADERLVADLKLQIQQLQARLQSLTPEE